MRGRFLPGASAASSKSIFLHQLAAWTARYAPGIVLSLASGWTTWDGMKNFTGEPILSAMVTFGIQGVMLIVAWLIGESFATGMNQQMARKATASPTADGSSKDQSSRSPAGLTLDRADCLGSPGGIFILVRNGQGRSIGQPGMPCGLTYIAGAGVMALRSSRASRPTACRRCAATSTPHA